MRTTTSFLLPIAALGAVLAAALLLARYGNYDHDARAIVLAGVVVALVAISQRAPVGNSAEDWAPLDGVAIFAAALLFDPLVAVALVAIAVVLAQGIERVRAQRAAGGRLFIVERRYAVTLVRSSLQAGAAGLVLAAGGWRPGVAQPVSPALFGTLGAAALVIWLLGSLVTAAAIARETGVPAHRLWRQAAPGGLAASLPLFGLCLVGALLAHRYSWALPLVALPAIAWRPTLLARAQHRNLDGFVESLADTVDARDRHTLDHSRRVADYAGKIAAEMGLPKAEIARIVRAARVHDVGNLSIERTLLVRDDTLTGEEWRAIKRHPAIGSDLLARFPHYAPAAPLVRHHHERVDGAGYPDGLYGEHIPIGARVIAVADALDAMASTRPYRPALPAEAIRAELTNQRDRQWDGRVVDALLRLVDRGEIALPGDERLHAFVSQEEAQDAGLGALSPPAQPGERTALEAQLMYQVFHDPLTGLPNRALFMDRLEHALARIRRSPDAIAVIFIDLDNFKAINDSWGHQAGDDVLIEVARRLEGCLRPGDTVARLAGDELTLLIESIGSVDDACTVAERVIAALGQPVDLGVEQEQITASLGIAFSSSGQESAPELLHNADTAMYRAKRDGKAGYAVYEPGMRSDAAEMVELKQDIVLAMERGELRVFYQPRAMLDSGRIVGMEALIRWQHPERGLILPAEFLPAAGHTGIVAEIDRLVLRDALRQLVAWRMAQAGGPPLVVSVNISARTFAAPSLAEDLVALLAEFRLDPRSLMLEVTEDVAMHDPEAAIERFAALKRVGILLAIDNFGAGSSSLSYLKRFPVDTLKIARGFVDGLGYNLGDTAVVRSIIAFASTMRRSVAAEGIETAEQFFQLRGLGCDAGQGNHLAPPLTRETISALLASGATLPLGRVGRGEFHAPRDMPDRPPASAIAPTRRIADAAS